LFLGVSLEKRIIEFLADEAERLLLEGLRLADRLVALLVDEGAGLIWPEGLAKKLVDRVKLHNTEAAAGVQDINMLRPIPQSQIDLVTEGPPYPQNPGYQ